MRFIPIDKMSKLREAAKSGDERAKQILRTQMDDGDFSLLLEEYFKEPEQKIEPIKQEGETVVKVSSKYGEVTDPKLLKFLQYNGVKLGDPEYDETIEAYYEEFPKARPGSKKTKVEEEIGRIDTSDIDLPSYEDNTSIYSDDDEAILEDEEILKEDAMGANVEAPIANVEEKSVLDRLMEEEMDAIRSYSDAIVEIMSCERFNENEKKGIIARLEEIRKDEEEHFSELKQLKESAIKKENGVE